jgi:hypothetical protein
MAIWLRGLERWYLVLGGVAVGRGFEPQSDLVLSLAKILNVLKLMGKHFIDPKSSEILSIFQVFPCTTQIALFGQNALFLKKP